MLFAKIDEQAKRRALEQLGKFVLTATLGKKDRFEHQFISTLEAATWLVCSLNLAKRTPSGFSDAIPPCEQASTIGAIATELLPLVEDAATIALKIASFYWSKEPAKDWPFVSLNVPSQFYEGFAWLAMATVEGRWLRPALPLLIRADVFQYETLMDIPETSSCIRSLAHQAYETMPPEVVGIMEEDARQGNPGQRLPNWLEAHWRFGSWLTPAERAVSRRATWDPLCLRVAGEIEALRAARH
jgi:hypothetical protein